MPSRHRRRLAALSAACACLLIAPAAAPARSVLTVNALDPGNAERSVPGALATTDPYTGQAATPIPVGGPETVVMSAELPASRPGTVLDVGYEYEITNEAARGTVAGRERLLDAAAYTRVVLATSPRATTGEVVSAWTGHWFAADLEHHQAFTGRAIHTITDRRRGWRYVNVVARATTDAPQPTGNACTVRKGAYNGQPGTLPAGTAVPCALVGEPGHGSLSVLRYDAATSPAPPEAPRVQVSGRGLNRVAQLRSFTPSLLTRGPASVRWAAADPPLTSRNAPLASIAVHVTPGDVLRLDASIVGELIGAGTQPKGTTVTCQTGCVGTLHRDLLSATFALAPKPDTPFNERRADFDRPTGTNLSEYQPVRTLEKTGVVIVPPAPGAPPGSRTPYDAYVVLYAHDGCQVARNPNAPCPVLGNGATSRLRSAEGQIVLMRFTGAPADRGWTARGRRGATTTTAGGPGPATWSRRSLLRLGRVPAPSILQISAAQHVVAGGPDPLALTTMAGRVRAGAAVSTAAPEVFTAMQREQDLARAWYAPIRSRQSVAWDVSAAGATAGLSLPGAGPGTAVSYLRFSPR